MQVAPDLRRRHAFEQRHSPHLEPEPLQQLEVATPAMPEAEVLARDDHAMPASSVAAKSSGSWLARSSVKSSTTVSATPSAWISSSGARSSSAARPGSPARQCAGGDARVSTRTGSPVSSAASITRRCPRCTPSNVPIATARLMQPGERLFGRDDPLLVGLLDAERADLQPAKADAMAAESLGDRPDVRTRADAEVEADDAVRIRDDVERVHPRAPQRHLDLDAAAVQLVGALAADLDRGGGRDRQLDLTPEGREPALELVRAPERPAARRPPPPDRPSTYGPSGRRP